MSLTLLFFTHVPLLLQILLGVCDIVVLLMLCSSLAFLLAQEEGNSEVFLLTPHIQTSKQMKTIGHLPL